MRPDDQGMNSSPAEAPARARVAGTASVIVLALSGVFSALMTAVLVLLLSQPIGIPECASFDPEGQRAAQVVGLGIVAALGVTWALAAVGIHHNRGRVAGRLALAVVLPAALLAVFVGGGAAMTAAVDSVADSSDHAMCW